MRFDWKRNSDYIPAFVCYYCCFCFLFSLLRREARDIISRNVRCSRDDVVFFTGTGTTGALKLLFHLLNLQQQCSNNNQDLRPIVFLGPYEHHSNILPWRECGCKIVQIKEVKQNQ